MTEKNQVYKCEVCGNIVEVLHGGAGQLVCCGKPMTLLKENTVDADLEKHVPVIEGINNRTRVRIKVGKVPHPMTEEHYIEWIEIITEDRVLRKFLQPSEKPEKEFTVRARKFTARAYCNLHGLWKTS